MAKKAQQTILKITKVPQVYNKSLAEEDFLFFIDKLYNER